MRDRGAGVRVSMALVAAFVVPGLVLAAGYGRDWHLPGLYMDAINPEYLIPGMVRPPAPIALIVPGNLLGGRFPVFTGTVYHGSTQLYAALPFMKVFGPSLFTFRSFELLVGGAILLGVLSLSAVEVPAPRRAAAVGIAGILALDPAFVLSLRTQAYSCMFPLLLLFGCVWLLRGWRRSRRPWLRVVAAGVLYGLAVFSYFIFGFFLPAVLWLLLRNPDGDPRRPVPATLAGWAAGVVVGYAPFICGVLLLRHALGGTSQALDWLRQNSEQLHTTSDTSGVLHRIDTMVTQSRTVFTGEWPWLMILGRHHPGLLNDLKADVLLALPVGVLALPRLAGRAARRAVAVPLALALSFAVGGVVFGARLGGHHYTAVLPLLYLAFGIACAMLLPWRPDAGWRSLFASRADAARSVAVAVAVGITVLANVTGQQGFHRTLLATGGVKWYTNAIDLFARDLDHTTPGATVYTPDWGYSMPVAFLSTAFPVTPTVDLSEIHQEGCTGKPQLVVFDGVGNEAKLRLVARLSGRPLERVVTWSRRDGVPVFQVGQLATASGCPTGGAAVRITPQATPACRFLAQTNIRTVTWSVRDPHHHGVEVTIRPPGGPEKVWMRGRASGSGTTGAWAVPGMRFVLRDAVTHRQLGSSSVGSAPCPVS